MQIESAHDFAVPFWSACCAVPWITRSSSSISQTSPQPASGDRAQGRGHLPTARRGIPSQPVGWESVGSAEETRQDVAPAVTRIGVVILGARSRGGVRRAPSRSVSSTPTKAERPRASTPRASRRRHPHGSGSGPRGLLRRRL